MTYTYTRIDSTVNQQTNNTAWPRKLNHYTIVNKSYWILLKTWQ